MVNRKSVEDFENKNAKFINLYNDGVFYREIEKELNISKSTVKERVRKGKALGILKDRETPQTVKKLPKEALKDKFNDKLRTTSLNRQHLEVKKGKNYSEIVFIGDVHYGAKYCNIEKFEKMLKYCLDNEIYIFCMGDMIETSSRHSVGAGVYEQISPQKQIEDIISYLKPLANKGLILGYLSGNHELRAMKELGIDISKIVCKELKVPYLEYAGWSLFYVGNQSYSIYSIHGSSSATLKHTKFKSILDISKHFEADLVTMGHVHDIIIDSAEYQRVNKKRKIVEIRKSYIVVTGHYYNYGGYAKEKGYSPTKIGSPKVKLFSDKFDIHISV